MNFYCLYFKSVLTNESHTQHTLGIGYDQLSISAIPYFWLCLLFWQDLQDLSCDRMVSCIPLQSTTDLIVSLRREWLGLGNGDTNWLPYM
jgi:hypothetical protein